MYFEALSVRTRIHGKAHRAGSYSLENLENAFKRTLDACFNLNLIVYHLLGFSSLCAHTNKRGAIL